MNKKLLISTLLGVSLMTSPVFAMGQITDGVDTVLSKRGGTGGGCKAAAGNLRDADRFSIEFSNAQPIKTDGSNPALIAAKIQFILARKGFMGILEKDAIIERKLDIMSMVSSILQTREIYKRRWYNLPINYMIQLWYHNCNGMEHGTGLTKPSNAQKIGFIIAIFIAQATTTYGIRNAKTKLGVALLAANVVAFFWSAIKKGKAKKETKSA